MKRSKKSHYRGKNGRAACGAHVPSYRVGPRGLVRVTCLACTSADRRTHVEFTGRRLNPWPISKVISILRGAKA